MKRLTLLILFIGFSKLFGQEIKSIEGLKNRFFERVLTIKGNNDQVEGYVVYYMSEKQGSGIRTFAVQTYDLELNEVALTTLDVAWSTNILSTAFNGQNLCVVFGDGRKKMLKAVTYDKNGKKQGELDWKLNRWREASAHVYAGETGFYLSRILKNSKYGFEIIGLNNSLSERWKKTFMPTKGYEGILLAKSFDDKFVFVKEKGSSSRSKQMTVELVTLSEKDGETVGQFNLFDGRNTFLPSAIRIDNEGNLVLGGMYFDGPKYQVMNSTGVYVMKVKPDGQFKRSTNLPWSGKMQEYLAQSRSKGLRIDLKNKIIFEDIVMYNGGYQLIGETYSKSLFTLFQLCDYSIGSRTSPNDKGSLFNIKDILIFNFDKELEFSTMQLIAKKEVNIACYGQFNGMFALKLADCIHDYGFFNYQFSEKKDLNSGALTVVSTNRGDFVDNFKRVPHYSITQVEPEVLEPKEKLYDIATVDEKSKIRRYGILRNTNNSLMIYYHDPKFDALRLYVDKLEKLKL